MAMLVNDIIPLCPNISEYIELLWWYVWHHQMLANTNKLIISITKSCDGQTWNAELLLHYVPVTAHPVVFYSFSIPTLTIRNYVKKMAHHIFCWLYLMMCKVQSFPLLLKLQGHRPLFVFSFLKFIRCSLTCHLNATKVFFLKLFCFGVFLLLLFPFCGAISHGNTIPM